MKTLTIIIVAILLTSCLENMDEHHLEMNCYRAGYAEGCAAVFSFYAEYGQFPTNDYLITKRSLDSINFRNEIFEQ